MSKFILLLSLIFSFSSFAQDFEQFCVEEINFKKHSKMVNNIKTVKCETMQRWSDVFKDISATLGVATITCALLPEPTSKIYAPVLGFGAGVSTSLSFIARKWPCEASTRPANSQEQYWINQNICDLLGKIYDDSTKRCLDI